MSAEIVRVMQAHRERVHGGDPLVFADCCEALAVDVVRLSLAGEAARLRELHDALTTPLPDVSCGVQDTGQRTLAP